MPTKITVNKITINDMTGKSLSQTALTAADPSPRPGVYRFDNYDAGDESRNQQCGVGERCNQGIPECVFPDDQATGDALGASELEVLGIEYFEHRRARQPQICRGGSPRQDQRGQDHMSDAEAFAPRAARQPVQDHGEEQGST